jgi:hypothetical protein
MRKELIFCEFTGRNIVNNYFYRGIIIGYRKQKEINL